MNMEKDSVLADAIYKLCSPKQLSLWRGCASEPKYMSKRLATTDVSVLASMITRRMPSIKEVNAVEETSFVTIGYPPCWKDDKKLYFIRDSKEIDLCD
jgi:hypothetical protein